MLKFHMAMNENQEVLRFPLARRIYGLIACPVAIAVCWYAFKILDDNHASSHLIVFVVSILFLVAILVVWDTIGRWTIVFGFDRDAIYRRFLILENRILIKDITEVRGSKDDLFLGVTFKDKNGDRLRIPGKVLASNPRVADLFIKAALENAPDSTMAKYLSWNLKRIHTRLLIDILITIVFVCVLIFWSLMSDLREAYVRFGKEPWVTAEAQVTDLSRHVMYLRYEWKGQAINQVVSRGLLRFESVAVGDRRPILVDASRPDEMVLDPPLGGWWSWVFEVAVIIIVSIFCIRRIIRYARKQLE